ncbi:unnamed protein product [Hyaloperonospora brassicae]|uniref:Sec39 domain-containing protein n=1 Tax=Hyaloperonospora brassicae TaxID=162125 RepID=A0AAV0UNH5_HYABA|nr:unnamed protein product [Hyaloperonospora brassicae]
MATAPPLLLAARELVRGAETSLPLNVTVVAFAVSPAHVAVVFCSHTERRCARLGVFKTAESIDEEKVELFFDLVVDLDEERASEGGESHHWSIVWSPDLKFLVVSGGSGGIMWVFTCPQWLDCTASPKAPADSSQLLRVDPSNYLTRKHWNPATNIVSVFFPTQSGKTLFVLSEDGVWLRLNVRLAKLALHAMEQSASQDTIGMFSMKTVKTLTQWHAGITAACYDLASCLLVVSGGVSDPSLDLVRKQASSLSVWKVGSDTDSNEPGELLDFTLLVKGRNQQFDDDASHNETEELRVHSAVTVERSGLLARVKGVLFGLVGMHVDSNLSETRSLQGFVRHLALAPNGTFVSMVDDLGRIAIRKVDACADVLKWQEVQGCSIAGTEGIAVATVVWLTSDLVGLMLSNNSVIFARFETHCEEKTIANGDEEKDKSLGLSASLEFIPVRFHRHAMSVLACAEHTLAFDVIKSTSSAENNSAFTAVEFVLTGNVWTINEIQSLNMKPFIELLMNEERLEDALEMVAFQKANVNGVSADEIHRRMWKRYRKTAARLEETATNSKACIDPNLQDLVLISTQPQGRFPREDRGEFRAALDHLRAMSDKDWVLDECLHLIADDSFTNMKHILDLAWDALVCLNNGDEVADELLHKKVDLQRFIYRLETLRLIMCEENGLSTMPEAADGLVDGATYALFRSSSVSKTAKQFAREGRVDALKILLHRHSWNLVPCWMDILEQISSSVSPYLYAELLLTNSAQNESNDHIWTLRRSIDGLFQSDDGNDLVTSVALSEQNYHYDLTDEEQIRFNEYTSIDCDERNMAYYEWLRRRVLELDSRYGQLAFSYQLSRLASTCLSEWAPSGTKKPLEELFLQTERLYNCVHTFNLSACCLLPLDEWSTLSMHDQAMIVVGASDKELADDITLAIERLEKVFVTQRQDCRYALDDLMSRLAHTVSSKYSLPGLTLAAEIIKRSSPSIEPTKRWIQSDTQLIETALNVVYSVHLCKDFGGRAPIVGAKAYMQRHSVVVEQCWTIFQSLPIRKENDLPEIAQLQVAVDEMEGLLIAVDVLSKYGVATLPGQLKSQILANSDGATGECANVGLHDLIEEMSSFAFSGKVANDKENGYGSQWVEVLQDAAKLKEHAFGERLSQEMVLDIILKQLLASERVDVNSAQAVVKHWIASDVEAIERVLDNLFAATRAKLDCISGYSEGRSAIHTAASSCVSIARQLLSLPVWDGSDRAVRRTKEYYTEALSHEQDVADACELLDLLTHGTMKMSPPQLRTSQPEEDVLNIRLNTVYQVFASNPSNYKPSVRVKEWLGQRRVGELNDGTRTDSCTGPLFAIMHLAKLLHVETQKLNIWMKGAYAALYCIDYEVAYDLTMKVIANISAEADRIADCSGGGDQVTLLHLVSLVLDLVSASSFYSWTKKRNLCCALFSVSDMSSTGLFAHQATDLVLSWFEKVDAVCAILIDLGLSDADLEQRRLIDGKNPRSAESALLRELKIVVALLVGEKDDRRLILRLLQRGVRLAFVLSESVGSITNYDIRESVLTFLQQMVQICVQGAGELAPTSNGTESGDWRQYMELAFGYLYLLGEYSGDYGSFEAFCVKEVLSPLFVDPAGPKSSTTSSSDTLQKHEIVVRGLHDFYLLQAAQANEVTITSDLGALSSRSECLTTLPFSYETTQMAASFVEFSGDRTLDNSTDSAAMRSKPRLLSPEHRNVTYLSLAQRCQEWLVSQKKSQEFEQMTLLLGTKFDTECFLQDESYRKKQIMSLATKKEHFHLSKQLATKYGIDEYECLLAYIKCACLFPSHSCQAGRREQLDETFSIDRIDILGEALQRPIDFGDFLLQSDTGGDPGLYDMIDGTDHVGVLFVLRMILECSKRSCGESVERMSPHEYSLFPLPKGSIDKISLLFMCFKKLKSIRDSLDVLDVNLKLIGTASTTKELLTPVTDPEAMTTSRKVAVEAVRPLLTGKTVKVATKILRRLYNVTPSAMVMIYINDLLMSKWKEDGTAATSDAQLSDVAFRAYEACVPCLSVLSNEHLMVFHHMFLNGSKGKHPLDLVTHLDLTKEFYGQRLIGLQHFGGLLTPEKRVDFVTDTLSVFQSKYNSWQLFGPRSSVSSSSSTASSSSASWDPTQYKRKEQELSYLERELAENMCHFLLEKIGKSGLTFAASESAIDMSKILEPVTAAFKAWFAVDPLQQATNEDSFCNTTLMELCHHVTSVDLSSLIMELALRAGGSTMSEDTAATVIAESYKTAVTNLVNRHVDPTCDEQKRCDRWVERLVWTWITGASVPSSSEEVELRDHLRATLAISRDEKSKAHALYMHAVMLFSQSPSALLKEIGSARQSEMYSPSDGNEGSSKSLVAVVRQTVLSQWEQLIRQKEDQRKWSEAAILSHVLQSCEFARINSAKLATCHLGLQVKAVWSALLMEHEMDRFEPQRVFSIPSHDMPTHFAAVFEELLSFVEAHSGDGNAEAMHFAEQATVALSNLLVRRSNVQGDSAQCSDSAWRNEQRVAMQARTRAQFQVGAAVERPTTSQKDVALCWSALFARGIWGTHLLDWYTAHAYAELSSEAEGTEAVVLTHWEASKTDVAVQLLLMCPFDELRSKHVDRLLHSVQQLPRDSPSWSAVMELALLRFDVAELIQHGLYSSVVAFLLQDVNREPVRWTSSGAYVVCALVMQGEYAAAGRLTCALRHAHPLLWDVENARLLLSSYLRTLASLPMRHSAIDDTDQSHVQHEVYVKTSRHLAKALD